VSRGRQALLWVALLAIVYAVFEAMAAAGLYALARWRHVSYAPIEFRLNDSEKGHIELMIADQMGMRTLHPRLGWTGKPGSRGRWGSVNALGARGPRQSSAVPPPGVTRIAAFGDSYTLGQEVRDTEVWTESAWRGNPAVEVLNFGVAGYGLDQAYLRYLEEGRALRAEIVLIGFMSENIARHVNVFRPFYLRPSLPASKPRFALVDAGLELVENPLRGAADYRELVRNDAEVIPRLGERDYFYQRGYRAHPFDFLPSVRVAKVLRHELAKGLASDEIYADGRYNPMSEAYRITIQLLRAFYDAVLEDGGEPVVVLFFHPGDFVSYRDEGSTSYDPLVAWLRSEDLRYVDALDAFKHVIDIHDPAELFIASGHYTPLGNELIGRHVRAQLEAAGLLRAAPATRSDPAGDPIAGEAP